MTAAIPLKTSVTYITLSNNTLYNNNSYEKYIWVGKNLSKNQGNQP